MNERQPLRIITSSAATLSEPDDGVSIATSADLSSAEALNGLCNSGECGLVAIGNATGTVNVAALRAAADAMHNRRCAGCWLPLAGDCYLCDIGLPAWLTVHVRGAAAAGMSLFVRQAGERLFDESPDPVAARLRKLAEGGRIAEIPPTSPVAELGVEFDWPELTPGKPSAEQRQLADAIHDLDVPAGGRLESRVDWIALKAGLLQACDDLDGSHALASEVQGDGRHVAGDYWHAIMHRREPDYGNSKYWFRRVGRHPAFAVVATAAAEILDELRPEIAGSWPDRLKLPNDWDPFAFVDLAEEAGKGGPPELETAVRQIQWAEIVALLRQTCDDAF